MSTGTGRGVAGPEAVLTERLRLEPITLAHARDLWIIHNDPAVARWYSGSQPTLAEARERAEAMSSSWRVFGVHKWMAYERDSRELVGRGGLSPTPADDDWGRVTRFLPGEPWTGEVRRSRQGDVVYANWVEIGWALRSKFWGHGYATEIGRAGLDYAFHVLDQRAVVSCTDVDNARSVAVMERLGMGYVGTLSDLGGGADLVVYTMLRPASSVRR